MGQESSSSFGYPSERSFSTEPRPTFLSIAPDPLLVLKQSAPITARRKRLGVLVYGVLATAAGLCLVALAFSTAPNAHAETAGLSRDQPIAMGRAPRTLDTLTAKAPAARSYEPVAEVPGEEKKVDEKKSYRLRWRAGRASR